METRLKCGHTLQLRHLPRLCPFMSSSPKTEIVAEVACIKSSNDIFAKLVLVKSDVFFPFDRIAGFTRSFFLAFCSSSHLRAQLKLSESFWSYRKVSSPLGTSSTLSLLSFSFSSSSLPLSLKAHILLLASSSARRRSICSSSNALKNSTEFCNTSSLGSSSSDFVYACVCVDAFFVSLCAIILCSVEFFSVCVHASLLFDLASVFIVGGDTEFRVSPELPFCFVRSCTFKCFNAWRAVSLSASSLLRISLYILIPSSCLCKRNSACAFRFSAFTFAGSIRNA